MEFINLGSGSSGNCYVLKTTSGYIMIECGLEYKKIISKLDDYELKIEDIKYLLVSHKHSDHAKSIDELKALNIPFIAPFSAPCGEKVKILDKLWVLPFMVRHDVDCYGYIIYDSGSAESLLFLTDTRLFDFKYIYYTFDYIMIECNHIRKQLEAIMQTALDKGDAVKVFKYKRQASYHMGLGSCKKFLSNMNLTKTKSIFLIHLSRECCNDAQVKAEIKELTKRPTYVMYWNGGIN